MTKEKIKILSVTIDNITRSESVKWADQFLATGKFHQIVTPGPEFLLEASAHEKFGNILNRADLSIADGMGIHIGALITKQRLKQRIPGSEFVDDLMALAVKRQARIFLFGGQPGVADRAAINLLKQYPGLTIVGTESGFREPGTKIKNQRIIERIHLAKPDILLVALGAPKQELWIDQHRHDLHNVSICIGVGRTLDYISGKISRPPKIWRTAGLEWMYTYFNANKFHEAGRRRQRVTNALIYFLIATYKHRHAK